MSWVTQWCTPGTTTSYASATLAVPAPTPGRGYVSGPVSVRTQSSGNPCAYDQPVGSGGMTVTGIPSAWICSGRPWRCQCAWCSGGVLSRISSHVPCSTRSPIVAAASAPPSTSSSGAALGRVADQLQRLLWRPVRSVGMALGWHRQREVATAAGPPLDLLEQPWRRLGQVGDHEHSSGCNFGHEGHASTRGRSAHHPERVSWRRRHRQVEIVTRNDGVSGPSRLGSSLVAGLSRRLR